jgi:DNA (cytosine-5)-methyltransferase 1
MNFIDLFSGAGGLSEGFIRQGFNPIAHVEIDGAACNTLRTRTAYHYLVATNNKEKYIDYLKRKITREELYKLIPEELINSVINKQIGGYNNRKIYNTIDKLLDKQNVDLIIGGPPCQAYSLIGRGADKNGMKGDERNHLYIEYANFLRRYKPKVFVFENVVGLLSAKDESDDELYLDKMRKRFRKIGYNTELKVLEADDFGVLQKRKRIILIGKRGLRNKNFYPDFKKVQNNITVKQLFHGLPNIQAGEGEFYITKYNRQKSILLENMKIQNGLDFTTQHIARPHNETDKEIYQIAVDKWNKKQERLNYNDLPERLKNHKNRNSFTDRFKVVAQELPSCHTVVAHIAKDGHYYIHPDIQQNRSITPREAARLQSFPDDYFFEGQSEKPSRTAAFKQIGNAVPPLMAEEIAKEIKKLL